MPNLRVTPGEPLHHYIGALHQPVEYFPSGRRFEVQAKASFVAIKRVIGRFLEANSLATTVGSRPFIFSTGVLSRADLLYFIMSAPRSPNIIVQKVPGHNGRDRVF